MAVDHYENFPVASILLPRRLRSAVAAIYHFARGADDIADEGNAPPEERLAALAAWRAGLDRIERGEADERLVFQRLAPVIAEYRLPLQLFHDLLDAFTQDVTQTRYATYAELLDYCRRSADPVGRLLLCLYRTENPQQLAWSDAICSGLQLVNHWQDVAVDWQKPRVYLPQEDLERFGVTEDDIAQCRADERWAALMRFQVDRARGLLMSGAPLARTLPGRMGLELRLIVCGGLRILEKIEAVNYDVFRRRPVLVTGDWLRIIWRALFNYPRQP